MPRVVGPEIDFPSLRRANLGPCLEVDLPPQPMNTMPLFSRLRRVCCVSALALSLVPTPHAQSILYGLSPTNSLIVLAEDGEQVLDGPTIRGQGAEETIVAIDFRPFTGALYAVSRDASQRGRLYVVNPASGTTTPVALAGPDLVLTGSVGMDFNPAALGGTNALRLVTSEGLNYRLVFSDAGANVNVDTPLNSPSGAPIPRVGATAYANNRAGMPGGGGAGGTIQYAIDAASDQLYRVNPPNAGVLTNGLPLGVDVTEDAALDIVTGSQRAVAILDVGGAKDLFQIDLATGAATRLRSLGREIVDLAAAIPSLVPLPVVYGLTASNALVRFSASGGPMVPGPAIAGLAEGEAIVGIDYRPLTGELFAVSRDASQVGRVYRVDTASGTATPVPLTGPQLLLTGDVDIDFNPAALSGVNALRIVTGDAANYRLVFDASSGGATVNVDTPLNVAGAPAGTASQIVATAYANNRAGLPGAAGAGGTSQFAIDAASDQLFRVNPPNAGILTNGLPLGFDVGSPGGLDFDTASDRALAIVALGDARWLVEVDTKEGGFVPLRTLPGDVKDLAIPIPTALPASSLVGLTTSNSLVLIPTDSTPVTAGRSLTGLATGETLVGIDFRPFDGRLYALGRDTNGVGNLYTVEWATGALTPVPLSGGALNLSSAVGIDFNPAALGGTNALRIVTSEGTNYRLVFNSSGATVNVDTPLNLPDAPAPRVTATAYSNNRSGLPGGAGLGGTVQYAIDTTRDTLFRVNPPNGGVLTEPKPLGVDVREAAGLDLLTDSDRALAVLDVDGIVGLYEIQLSSGAAHWVRGLPSSIIDLAAPMPATLRYQPRDGSPVARGGIGPFAIQRAETVMDPFCTTTVIDSGNVPLNNEGSVGYVRLADLANVPTIPLTVALSGAAERPSPVETSATGQGTLTVSGNTLTFRIEYQGLSGPALMAHIHGPADSSGNAGVQIDLAPFNGGSFGTSGTLAGSTVLTSEQKLALLSGKTYVNLHTASAPAGEIRGQIGAAAFRAVLSGGAERPTSVLSPGTGFATFRLSGHELTLDISHRGLGSQVIGAHIHGAAGSAESASILIDLAPFHQGTFGPFGSFRGTVTLTPDQRAALVDGKTYVNLHTPGFPAGEVRGQIRPILEGTLLTATLDGASERPDAVSTPGTGSAQCILAGDTLSFIIAYRGLGGPATAAHLHGPATASGTAGVQVDLTPFHRGPFRPEGIFVGSVVLTPAQKTAVWDGNFYVNIHTANNPGGEIRGQLLR